MIKINLLGEETVDDGSDRLQLFAFAGSLVLLLCIFAYMRTSLSSEVATLGEQKKTLESEVNRLKAQTKEVKDLEAKRKDLDDKLLVIARLKKSKRGPVRVLDDLNVALPERAWIEDINEKAGFLSISGIAIDLPTVSQFAKALTASKFFKNPEITETTQKKREGTDVQAFTVRTAISYAGVFEDPKAKKEEEEAPPPKKSPAKKPAKGDDV